MKKLFKIFVTFLLSVIFLFALVFVIRISWFVVMYFIFEILK